MNTDAKGPQGVPKKPKRKDSSAGRGESKDQSSRIVVNRDWCKGCGICVEFCPRKVLELDREEKAVVKHPDQCDRCGICRLRCPDLAIELK
ncbi:MAG: 4Fe-4S binding protein [Deltaproteobacteria bacterium]|nr:4Fe-4S binding protein [Deltaproteobacteria bacterium]